MASKSYARVSVIVDVSGRLRELDELWLEAAELLVEHNGSMLVHLQPFLLSALTVGGRWALLLNVGSKKSTLATVVKSQNLSL